MYVVELAGCDDCTSVEIEMTDEQLEFLTNLSESINKESYYGCMPKMYITKRED